MGLDSDTHLKLLQSLFVAFWVLMTIGLFESGLYALTFCWVWVALLIFPAVLDIYPEKGTWADWFMSFKLWRLPDKPAALKK